LTCSWLASTSPGLWRLVLHSFTSWCHGY